MSSISVEGLSKCYGSRYALRNVSLEVGEGEFLSLLGPSGGGKTTLMRCIAGLEAPDAGEIRFDRESVLHLTPAQRDVAMVFASYALYPHLTVFENLAYPLRERRLPLAEIARRVHRIAEILRISHTLDRLPHTCSGGEMQRVALGRALVREARLYLFDEPLSHLDAQLREEMRSELKRLHREIGRTLLYATSDPLEAMSLSDRVVVLRKGQVDQCASPEELYLRPANAFVATYVGEPPMNLLPAESWGSHLRTAFFEMPFGNLSNKKTYLLGIRPEDIRVGDVPEGVPTVSFRASLYALETRGDEALLTVERDKTFLRILTTPLQKEEGEIQGWFFISRACVIDPATDAVLFPPEGTSVQEEKQ